MSKYFISLLVGLIFIVIGVNFFIYDLFKYDYIDSIPVEKFEFNELTIEQTFSNKLLLIDGDYIKSHIIEDDSIIPGNTEIMVRYYDELIDLDINKVEGSSNVTIDVDINYNKNNIEGLRTLFNLCIDNLKERTIYNYSLLFRPEVYIYIHSNDRLNVKIMND
ncbi:MAG: hypothetical protein PHY26_01435 [Bacilli bacterium]|jgi:hypothetical protein|nr:hypothetical protein [Bacilli bacterium]